MAELAELQQNVQPERVKQGVEPAASKEPTLADIVNAWGHRRSAPPLFQVLEAWHRSCVSHVSFEASWEEIVAQYD